MKPTTKVTTFQATVPRYAAVIGRRHEGVTVTYGGATAWTDGKRINIPALPAGTTMSPWQAKVFGGYIDHEAGHVRYSDIKHMPNRKKEPVQALLTNLIEDVRMENAVIKQYPGCRDYLDTLAYEVDQQGLKRDEGDGEPDQDWACRALQLIYKEGYQKYRGVDTKCIQGELNDYPEFQSIATLMAWRMPNLRDTKDAHRLAKEIEKLLPPIDYSKFACNRPMMVDFSSLSGEEKKKLKEAIQKALEQASEKGDRHEQRKDVLDDVVKDVQESNRKQAGSDRQKWGNQILPPVATYADKIFVPAERDAAAYQSARGQAWAEITAIKKMLSIYLRSRKKRAWSRGLEEGLLDQGRLHAFAAKDRRLFKEKRNRDLVDTAVEMVVDCSGSMDAQLTRMTTILLAEALSGIQNLKLEVTGFTTNHNFYSGDGGRAVGMDLLIYKGWDEPFQQAKDRLGALNSNRYTPLGEAYGYGFERVLVRKETRKVVWVITDGCPYFQVNNHDHSEPELMKEVFGKTCFFGVETIGMFVGYADLSESGPKLLKETTGKFLKVESFHDVPAAVMKLIREISRDE